MPVFNDAEGPFRDETYGRRSIMRPRRVVVLIASLGMISGVGLLAAGFVLAGVGSEPGNLSLNPASGATTLQPTWSTTDGCPSGYQMSAEMADFKTDGTLISRISPVVSAGLTAGFSGTLDFKMSVLASTGGFGGGGTVEFAIGCWNGPGGTGTGSTPVKYTQSIYVTVTSSGTYFTGTSASPSATPTITTSSTSSASPSTTASASPSTTASASPSTTASSTASASASPSPTSTLPSGGPQTGYGGAARPGGGSNLLIALGAVATAGSAAAMGVAVRRRGTPADGNLLGDGPPPAN
jgi:hypothetical protein